MHSKLLGSVYSNLTALVDNFSGYFWIFMPCVGVDPTLKLNASHLDCLHL